MTAKKAYVPTNMFVHPEEIVPLIEIAIREGAQEGFLRTLLFDFIRWYSPQTHIDENNGSFHYRPSLSPRLTTRSRSDYHNYSPYFVFWQDERGNIFSGSYWVYPGYISLASNHNEVIRIKQDGTVVQHFPLPEREAKQFGRRRSRSTRSTRPRYSRSTHKRRRRSRRNLKN